MAILLLVGFESVTAMGEEAKNPKKDVGHAPCCSRSRSKATRFEHYLFLSITPRIIFSTVATLSPSNAWHASGGPDWQT